MCDEERAAREAAGEWDISDSYGVVSLAYIIEMLRAELASAKKLADEVERLRAELARARKVVEAACKWSQDEKPIQDGDGQLMKAIVDYETGR